ncbi:16S rRNA (cytidine(1402)-2'-O)-methyltransferase [Umezakia ovalisporum]|jgi:16S rRNA (cytidine1402-2'-O)-methyltransferase|uniref:Ribosomal RNA small subunit methyltransferase I n=1 Tax=Umezakia ovalisporum FSS-43 TaxID=2740520 RepID=A0ABT6K0A3_9CYAN|nr:16S rRNA (cytidine(1402)-2'-O)-methyltransferase [Umezakia ovalisporum]MBI1240565.1 16S rRNA (cytidine(1402)-2'-O)-methyltransferase [Nostoc sp. RI_552]MDH6055540.1 16S rRNA (cytidine(1402)-2'-O)-methyltransferase [Umezakia ovalisporum FSS-43]MDH6067091.1 16S rRNA (cytidine(1402)-2'-O)-methyltransferase [Umezakia ovalisporum APH033B]MDH6070056.1 16S rRNA (cytidine(1402)-2'-O)-methyltransferase [Umezakia ovalisporum CobakiLakeA]MDH6073265.1 16S rRNA (cytidine(1402)-2'-O)-methyltransferase [U
MQTDPKPGTLYVVGTPIGNLEDITFRAVRILQTVNLIAAEDTRHTGKLLQHFEIKTPQISYHEHNRQSRIPELLEYMGNGQAIALVSDAGMPGISDPGYELVKACVDAGLPVVPIPGASAAITALSGAGLPTDKFVFEGFLPAKGQKRREYLEFLQGESRTLIFYESPHRLRESLQDLATVWGGERQIVLARELTKIYEEFWRGTIAEAIAYYSQREPQGEYTLVVAGIPPHQPQLTEEQLKAELVQLISQGISRSQASRQLAKITSLPRRQLYQLALSLAPHPE